VKLGYQCCFLAEFVVYGPLFVLEILRLIGRWCGLVVEGIILWPCVWGPSPVWLWVVLMVVGKVVRIWGLWVMGVIWLGEGVNG
jgi:hypothetical protein